VTLKVNGGIVSDSAEIATLAVGGIKSNVPDPYVDIDYVRSETVFASNVKSDVVECNILRAPYPTGDTVGISANFIVLKTKDTARVSIDTTGRLIHHKVQTSNLTSKNDTVVVRGTRLELTVGASDRTLNLVRGSGVPTGTVLYISRNNAAGDVTIQNLPAAASLPTQVMSANCGLAIAVLESRGWVVSAF